MSIVETLVKQIVADNKWLSQGGGKFDDFFLVPELVPEDFFDHAHDLDRFRDREPDSAPEHPEKHESITVLGTYTWMASPGVITLQRSNIETYWKSLLKDAHQQFPFIFPVEATRVLRIVVNTVHEHEKFHYVCDFSRRLFGSQFNRWHEEALAVAWEWQWLKGQDKGTTDFGRMHPTLRNRVVQKMFRHTSKGYRDWRNFAETANFYEAVREYLCPQALLLFGDTELNFGRWLVSHVADEGNRAWGERVHE